MTRVDFEALYLRDGDPWGYETSAYEREKYIATLEACGEGGDLRALELGGSIGVFSALLASRVDVLHTIDGAPTAVRAAARRLRPHPGAHARLGQIPEDLPAGPFDLVVASEVLYYLEPEPLGRTFDALRERMAPGARLVAVHWVPGGPERPFTAEEVHAALRAEPWLNGIRQDDAGDYLLDVLEVAV